jgi:hypothetical protein
LAATWSVVVVKLSLLNQNCVIGTLEPDFSRMSSGEQSQTVSIEPCILKSVDLLSSEFGENTSGVLKSTGDSFLEPTTDSRDKAINGGRQISRYVCDIVRDMPFQQGRFRCYIRVRDSPSGVRPWAKEFGMLRKSGHRAPAVDSASNKSASARNTNMFPALVSSEPLVIFDSWSYQTMVAPESFWNFPPLAIVKAG